MRKSWSGALACIALLSACAGLPQHVKKMPSYALRLPETTLGKIVAADNAGNNLSGLSLLSSGDEALASLIALADLALIHV